MYLCCEYPGRFFRRSDKKREACKGIFRCKKLSELNDKISIYKFEKEDEAVAAAKLGDDFSGEQYSSKKAEAGVYLIQQKDCFLKEDRDWKEIEIINRLVSFTVFKYDKAVHEAVKNHLKYCKESNWYVDIYKDSAENIIYTDGLGAPKVGYGIYWPGHKPEEFGGNGNLSEIIKLANDAGMSEKCIKMLEKINSKIESDDSDKTSENDNSKTKAYVDEKNEMAELLAVMHAVLIAKLDGENKISIVHDNENVMKYLTYEYKGKDSIKLSMDAETFDKFNQVYILFFKELEETWKEMDISFIHVYSH